MLSHSGFLLLAYTLDISCRSRYRPDLLHFSFLWNGKLRFASVKPSSATVRPRFFQNKRTSFRMSFCFVTTLCAGSLIIGDDILLLDLFFESHNIHPSCVMIAVIYILYAHGFRRPYVQAIQRRSADRNRPKGLS